ncbi:hypothetical protein RLOatenuis_1140 [Rickettsiales bacterium]|nr:hypothetical protein RLOatenuis_1140 [Rickettsiales bacterium]
MKKDYIADVSEIIEQARLGKMLIMVDEEQRENEGDMMIPGQFTSPDAINFMIRHGSGIICLALTQARANFLNLRPLPKFNSGANQPNFATPVDARCGVTTGVSAFDRSHTIAALTNPNTTREDIVSPGHIFTLIAKEGGVLERPGHTEAGVEIAKLAGLSPAMVICEVLNEDGTMARGPELSKFAKRHSIKICYISSLIKYLETKEKCFS